MGVIWSVCAALVAQLTQETVMSKIIRAAAAASLLMFGATTLMAQQKDGNVAVDKQIEKGDTKIPAKQAPSGALSEEKQKKDSNAAVDPVGKSPPDNTAVGSRAIGPTKDDKSTDPNATKKNEIQKLDKEGRGGQQN
jgi:hypothetical protein